MMNVDSGRGSHLLPNCSFPLDDTPALHADAWGCSPPRRPAGMSTEDLQLTDRSKKPCRVAEARGFQKDERAVTSHRIQRHHYPSQVGAMLQFDSAPREVHAASPKFHHEARHGNPILGQAETSQQRRHTKACPTPGTKEFDAVYGGGGGCGRRTNLMGFAGQDRFADAPVKSPNRGHLLSPEYLEARGLGPAVPMKSGKRILPNPISPPREEPRGRKHVPAPCTGGIQAAGALIGCDANISSRPATPKAKCGPSDHLNPVCGVISGGYDEKLRHVVQNYQAKSLACLGGDEMQSLSGKRLLSPTKHHGPTSMTWLNGEGDREERSAGKRHFANDPAHSQLLMFRDPPPHIASHPRCEELVDEQQQIEIDCPHTSRDDALYARNGGTPLAADLGALPLCEPSHEGRSSIMSSEEAASSSAPRAGRNGSLEPWQELQAQLAASKIGERGSSTSVSRRQSLKRCC